MKTKIIIMYLLLSFIIYFLPSFFSTMLAETQTLEGFESQPVTKVLNAEPHFQGSGTLLTRYDTTLLLSDIIGTYITAEDDYDGDLTDDISIISDNYSGNETTVGDYEVLLSVEDSSNNTTEFLLNIQVYDDEPPVIEGPDRIPFPTGANDALEDIISRDFTIIDDYDGEIDDFEIIVDEYSHDRVTLGDRTITFRAEDSSGNVAEKTFILEIVDEDPPMIIGPTEITLNLSESNTMETIMTLFTITDNYNNYEDLDIEWLNWDLPEEFDITGEYQTTLKVTDESGNSTTQNVSIEIYDDVPPVLTGPSSLSFCYTERMSLEDIKDELNVYDNYLDLTINDVFTVENTYDPDLKLIGTFQIVFEVSDENHTVSHTINITVHDKIPPVFLLDSRIIVDVGSPMSVEQLYNLVIDNVDLDDFEPVGLRYSDDVSTLFDNPGLHVVNVELFDENDDFIVYEIVFEVMEPNIDHQSSYRLLLGLGIIIISIVSLVVYKRR